MEGAPRAASPPAAALNATAADYRALFAWWSRPDASPHGPADPPLAEALARLLALFERDRARYADILEPSLSWTLRTSRTSRTSRPASLRRLSYAFPGFRADPAGTSRALRSLCAPFGDAILAQADRLLRAAHHASAAMPLFGVADDEPDARRIKLYLQFEHGHGPAPLALAERLLGARLLDRFPEAPPLHLLGIDLGDRGVLGAKLYFLHPRLDLAEAPARIGPVPLLAALSEGACRELRDVLTIHRLEAPDDPAVSRPVEINFALADSGLAWTDVRPLLPPAVRAATGPLAALEAAFPLRVRGISAPVGHADKLNLYYVLTPPPRA